MQNRRTIFNLTWFTYALIAFIALDVLSLFTYTISQSSFYILIVVAVAIVWVVLRDMRASLVLPLAELAWTSFGSSLSWDIGGASISLRMLIFAVIVGMWIAMPDRRALVRYTLVRAGVGIPFFLLFALVVWGVYRGLMNNNDIGILWNDANAYLYVAYLPIWASLLRIEDFSKIISMLLGASVGLAVKTLILLHLFAQGYDFANIAYLYIWVRDTRVGEITFVSGTFWRIFIQSQVYVALTLVGVLTYALSRPYSLFRVPRFTVLTLLIACIIASFSRSFWVGIACAMPVVVIFLWRSHRLVMRSFAETVLAVILGTVASGVLIYALASFPSGEGLSTRLLAERIGASSRDAAGISRIHQLEPLKEAIQKHPVLGSGFGTTVTYFSSDPRIKNASNPNGRVTTYAFEWGYLDQVLKFGMIFFATLVCILLLQWYIGIRIVKRRPEAMPYVALLLGGLLCIIVIHMFSPYLNHPLGLGYLMLVIAALDALHKVSAQESVLPISVP